MLYLSFRNNTKKVKKINRMTNDRVLEKVGWLTQIKTIYIPPITQEEVERLKSQHDAYIREMFRVGVMFLQENGMTVRTVLREGDIVDDGSQLTAGDLTEDGMRFYVAGITKWHQKLDRSANRTKIVADTSFLEKRYREYVDYELPLFRKLLPEVAGDKKMLESRTRLKPVIESVIAGLDGNMKEFFAKRSIKATVDTMYVFCYQYSLSM